MYIYIPKGGERERKRERERERERSLSIHPFSHRWVFGLLQVFFAIVNSAALSILVHVCWCRYRKVPLGYIHEKLNSWVRKYVYSSFFNVYLFERERESMCTGERQREGDRGSEAGSTLTAESPMWDSNSPTVRS